MRAVKAMVNELVPQACIDQSCRAGDAPNRYSSPMLLGLIYAELCSLNHLMRSNERLHLLVALYVHNSSAFYLLPLITVRP